MRLLLDTHALAWWLLDDRRLPSRVHDLIADPDNEIWASAVSAFEAGTKYRIGKWRDIEELALNFEQAVRAENFGLLAISAAHASCGGLLGGSHRDPFDRLLAAQSLIESLPLVTNDPAFQAFAVETVW